VYFYPDDPEYKCPKYNGKSRPSITFDPKKHKPYVTPVNISPAKQNCPNCSAVMIPGIITEAAESLLGLYSHSSVRWSAHGSSFIVPPTNSVFPLAYACPKCGKIDLYIQLIDPQEKKRGEKITYWLFRNSYVGYCLDCKTEYDFYQYGFFCPKCKKRNTEKRKK
jgi:Zn finger protein HypA/HybF involved in hydrogenase expression